MKGGIDVVAGSPSRTAAVGTRFLPSTTALVKWVVPIITSLTASGSRLPSSIRMLSDLTMPLVTSAVVGDLAALTTVDPDMVTASVFVPPTSTPTRMRPRRVRPIPPQV